MAVAFKSAGSLVTNPFTADPDPNVTPPANDRILEIPDRTVTGAISFGVRYMPIFTNPSISTVAIDITPWMLDETSGEWGSALKDSGVVNRDLLISPDLAPGRVFFQITNLAGGTIDSVEVLASAV
jgi:hypothetical protein